MAAMAAVAVAVAVAVGLAMAVTVGTEGIVRAVRTARRISGVRRLPTPAGWQTRYVFTTTPHPLADFEPRNHWQQTSPDSHFTRQRVVSRLTPTGRVTLSGQRLITTTHGRRDEVGLADDEVATALDANFGIVLA